MATLNVQEAMGMKVDREAVATLVLPQLWSMSIGPCKRHSQVLLTGFLTDLIVLSVSQFRRFMEVIHKLGDRVEKEHEQYLRDAQRIEDKSATAINGTMAPATTGPVDFESLVAGNSANTVKADSVVDTSQQGWDDDVCGSIFSSQEVRYTTKVVTQCSANITVQPAQSPSVPAHAPPIQAQAQLSPPPSHVTRSSSSSRPPRGLGAIPTSQPSFNSFSPPLASRPSLASQSPRNSIVASPLAPTALPRTSLSAVPAPNYNISLSATPTMQTPPMQAASFAPAMPMMPAMPAISPQPAFAPAPMSNILTPSKPAQPNWSNGASKTLSKDDWGDFDPLS